MPPFVGAFFLRAAALFCAMFCLRLAAMWDRPSPFVVCRMGRRPAKLHEKLWGRRFCLPTLDRARGWQAEAPAPPAFSTLSRLAKPRWPSPADRRFRYVAPGRLPSASSRDSWAASEHLGRRRPFLHLRVRPLTSSEAARRVLPHCPVDLPPPPTPRMPACSSRTWR